MRQSGYGVGSCLAVGTAVLLVLVDMGTAPILIGRLHAAPNPPLPGNEAPADAARGPEANLPAGEELPQAVDFKSDPASQTDDQSLQAYARYALTHPGNPAQGRTLFRQSTSTQCLACHRVEGEGGTLGPDLTHIGGKFGRPHLIESLLEPSRQIVEGYRTTIIRTRDGQIVTGILKQRDLETWTLVDASGQSRAIPVDQIEEQSESPQSLMPQGIARLLSPEQLTDLVAYLETLRPGGTATPGSQTSGPIRLPPGFVVRTLVTGLTACTAMEVLPNGDVLVAEQTGTLRLIAGDRLVPQPVATLPVDSAWERGLIGVTVAPDFPQQRWIYVCYVAREPHPHHRISRLAVDGPPWVATSEQVLFEGDDQRLLGGKVPAGHQGGAIHFGLDGKLYVAIGDQTAEAPAQRLNTLQGKILRLNPDGSFPEDNPFVQKATGKYRAIWALGLRNPFTFAVHPTTGELWINDVGGQYEEINRGVAGGNYGWPVVEHGPNHPHPFISPVHTYPQASIAGGDFCPKTLAWSDEWRGKYFFGDFVHGWIRALDPDQPTDVRTFGEGFHRPVDLRFDRRGKRLLVLLREAWVIDQHFQPGTGALLEVRYEP